MATEPPKSILADINAQKIVLPQFQRDFVWSPSFVIKLLTSLFNGYPIGSLLLMENNESYDYRPIDGVTGDRKQSEGETILVLDFLSGAPESKSAKIVREWREMVHDLNGEISAEAIRTFSLTPEDMRDATKASAIYKGVISLLIAEGVRDFGMGHRPVNNPNAQIEDHHIFPQQFLRNGDIKGYMANGILNRTPIYGDTNRAIGSTAPEVYFNDTNIVGNEPIDGKVLDGHAISLDLVTRPFGRDVFEAFCNDRQRRLVSKIERVTEQKILTQESEVLR